MPAERPDDYEELNNAHDALLGQVRRHQRPSDAGLLAALERHQPYRPPLRELPLIIDTDIGGDPDDAVALAVAARHDPRLALVVTSDEHDGQRARFARLLLDLLGRSDVPVVAGAPGGAGGQFCVADLLPATTPTPAGDVAGAVGSVMRRGAGMVRWVGLGPMSNLAAVTAAEPESAARLRVTQMGGALNYRDPERGEHNLRRDVAAAQSALAAVRRARLITSDVTFTEELAIDAQSEIYQRLAAPGAPRWANLLRAHFDRWFAGYHRSSLQHDPLTLSVAMGLPLVDVYRDSVSLDERGRMRLDPAGVEVDYSYAAHYAGFRRWLRDRLDPAPPAGTSTAEIGDAGD